MFVLGYLDASVLLYLGGRRPGAFARLGRRLLERLGSVVTMLTLMLASRKCVSGPVTRVCLARCSATPVPELSAEERLLLSDPGGLGGSTYGEITATGFQTLMASCELMPSDSFVDLGSGRGECVIQAAREYRVLRATGVELAPSRHGLAITALAASEADVRSRTSFILGDVGAPEAASALAEDSSVVWLSNLLFDAALMQRIASLLEAAPTVRCVAALRVIPGGLEGFVEDDAPILCQMSWTKPAVGGPGHPCVVYRRVTDGWWMGRRAS